MGYLDVLNDQQKEAVVHNGSPLLILAGAGSGKTRVITTKIAYLIDECGVDPYQILAVTFTKKAALEMKERAVALDQRAQYCQIRTFHSFGSWFLRLNAEHAGIEPNFTVYDDDDMVTLVAKSCPHLTKKEASVYAHDISLAKDYCLLPDSPGLSDIDPDPEFPVVYDAYQKRLRETGNCDFGDLILLPYLVLKNNEYVRQKMHARFQVLMVDEYQDSNIAQFKLLEVLSGVHENTGNYICVVGDDDQSIYKFRGAEVQNILNFQKIFPGTKIVRLESNYRSTAQILKIASDVVSNNEGRLGKSLIAEKGEGRKPVLAFLPNQDEEAEFCADLIKMAHDQQGAKYSDWAILYRTNAQSLAFESTFLHRKIPYQVVGSLKFYEREEIKDLLAYLSLIANPRDEIAFRRIINKPTRGIGNGTQDKIIDGYRSSMIAQLAADDIPVEVDESSFGESKNAANLVEFIKGDSLKLSKKAREGADNFVSLMSECKDLIAGEECTIRLNLLVDTIIEKSGLKEHYEGEDAIAGTQKAQNMQELSNSASLYELTVDGLLEFLDHIELDRTLETPDEEENEDRVTLITLHNTKGLEFPRVIMTGMETGIFPRPDKAGSELEEERRLCYVGITRAMNELYLTSCSTRRMYGRVDFMGPSCFLEEMDQDDLKIIGKKPSSFRSNSGFHGGDFGAYGLSHPDTESDPVKRKYCKGTKIFHDEYGYGIIVAANETDEGEYSISVSFENGTIKRFLPKYQQKSLVVIKD